MRALRYDEYGGPDVLHLTEAPDPHPGAGQVRIKVSTTTVNPWDVKVRSGANAAWMDVEFPVTPGLEAVGVVDEVGPGANAAIGDLVVGAGAGANAELAVLDAWALVPPGCSATAAVGVPVAAEASARLLGLVATEPGDTVVIDGAGGGVGTALTQLAVARGLRVVGTTAPDGLDVLADLGASPTPYGAGLPERVRALTDAPIAAAYDLSGRGVAELIELTGDPAKVASLVAFDHADDGIRLSDGSEGRAWDVLPEVLAGVAEGRHRVFVDRMLPWADAAAAHARSESGKARGKLILTVR